MGDRLESVHRIAWQLSGRRLSRRKKSGRVEIYVCHRCDNKRCVRLSHLFTGTNRDNAIDAMKKMRHQYGENNGRAILREEKVMEMRNIYQKLAVARKEYARLKKQWVSLVRSSGVRNCTAHEIGKMKLWKYIGL
jgi:hypothetical protein